MHMTRIGRRCKAAAVFAAAITGFSAVPARAADPYSAFVFSLGSSEPTIYNFINSATSTLDMTMYELKDTTAVSDLIAREKAGVKVRVILDREETSTNASAYKTLKAAGVGVVYSSSAFTYTHQKTITVDSKESLVLTGNLTSEYYPTSRDYGVFDNDATDVAAIEKVFNADYPHTSITPSDGDNLLWSPTTAEDRLLSVINGATTSLDIEEEEFSDSAVIDAIANAASNGVSCARGRGRPVGLFLRSVQGKNAGGTVGYSSSTGFYIHAKAIVADYGLSTQTVEAGSMNMTSNSLGSNRELGIILTDSGVATVIETAFNSDYAGGAPQ